MVENWDDLENLNIDKIVKNPDCSVNDEGFFTNNTSVKLFRCIKCADPEDLLVCESCAKKCHEGHKCVEEDNPSQNFICNCAKLGHKTKTLKFTTQYLKAFVEDFKNEKLNNFRKTRVKCAFLDIMKQLQFSSVFVFNGKNLCPVCMLFCVNRHSNLNDWHHYDMSLYLKSLNSEKINQESLEECKCDEINDREYHQSTQNSELLKRFFTSQEASHLVHLRKLIYVFLTNDKVYKYWEIVSTYNHSIYLGLQNKNYIKFQVEESIHYIKSLNLLLNIAKRLKADYMEIVNDYFTFEVQFKFLNELFSSSERKKDLFCLYKISNLKIFRKLFILPRLKYLFYMNVKCDCNTNTFHRLILQPHLEDFLSEIGLQFEEFFSLLNKIYSSIINYFYKFNEDDINSLIKEYLRYVRIVLNYKIDKDLIIQLINHIYKICELAFGTFF